MKKATLKVWENPKTGEKRIYVNSDSITFGDKVYIKKSNTKNPEMNPFGDVSWDGFILDCGVSSYKSRGYGSRKIDIICSLACKALKENGFKTNRHLRFDDIVNAIK